MIPRPCLITSREVSEASSPLTCSRPGAFEEKDEFVKKTETIRPTQNTPLNPQQPGDRAQVETACEQTRATLWPILSRFHRSGFWKSASSSSRNQRKRRVVHTHAHTQTNQIMATCTHPVMKRPFFCPRGKKRLRSLRSLGLASLLEER